MLGAVDAVEALETLESNLALNGLALATTPLVIQYNKRDLPNALPVAELDALLSGVDCPRFEGVAPTGVGVFDTLKAIVRPVLARLRAEFADAR